MEDKKKSKWEIGVLAVSIGFVTVLVMTIPWTYYYKNVLFWKDGPGIAMVLAVLAVLNCISLMFRFRIVEDVEAKLTDINEYHVAMAISSLANVFFWLGIAMWFVYTELNIERVVCFLVAAAGALGHTVLHLLRWRANKNSTTTILLAIYAFILIGLTWAYFTGARF